MHEKFSVYASELPLSGETTYNLEGFEGEEEEWKHISKLYSLEEVAQRVKELSPERLKKKGYAEIFSKPPENKVFSGIEFGIVMEPLPHSLYKDDCTVIHRELTAEEMRQLAIEIDKALKGD